MLEKPRRDRGDLRPTVRVGPEVRRRQRLLWRVRPVRHRARDGLSVKLGLFRRQRRAAVRVHDGGRLIVQLLRLRCRIRGRGIRKRWVRCRGIIRRRVVRTRRRRIHGSILRFVRVLRSVRIVANSADRRLHYNRARLVRVRIRVRVRGVRRIWISGASKATAAYGHVVVRIIFRFILPRTRRRSCCTRFLK